MFRRILELALALHMAENASNASGYYSLDIETAHKAVAYVLDGPNPNPNPNPGPMAESHK